MKKNKDYPFIFVRYFNNFVAVVNKLLKPEILPVTYKRQLTWSNTIKF